jgi:deoxyribodipyrimidine photo-lyase
MASAPSIVWLRDDLRLADHPALAAAAEEGPVLLVYILDDESPGLRPLGGASRWWLHHSLESLSAEVEARGGRLDVLRGPAERLIPELAVASAANAVFWTRRYGPAERTLDATIAGALRSKGVSTRTFGGALLHDPDRFSTKTGSSFRVFTPFWRALRSALHERPPQLVRAPGRFASAPWPSRAPKRVKAASLNLLPTKPDWAGGLRDAWRPGEIAARRRLTSFLQRQLGDYVALRDRPDENATSRLSPHLRFGELSPRQIWRAATHALEAGEAKPPAVEKFLSELAWREFSYHLLRHTPDLARRNVNATFDSFPWRAPGSELDAWRKGRTGYPIVDAGMRELWATGYMHNRVRLITSSFLVKDLLLDWRIGEAWFWDTLCDADPANNAASWQWSAGSGADAAPYFRVFNPILQSRKFDPEGRYIRRYVPELRAIPNEFLHAPWTLPPERLDEVGVRLGETYPFPVVDHHEARGRALAALRMTKAPSQC